MRKRRQGKGERDEVERVGEKRQKGREIRKMESKDNRCGRG